MRRNLVTIFMSLFFIIFLVACQSGNEEVDDKNNENNNEQNEVDENKNKKENNENNDVNNDSNNDNEEANTNDDTAALFQQIFESRDNVEIYDMDMGMDILINSPGGRDTSSLTVIGKIDEKNDEGNIELIEKNANGETFQHGVFYDGAQYVSDGETWQDNGTPLPAGSLKSSGTTYYNIIEAVRDFGEHAEVEEKDNKYIATYSGPAKDIFYIFQDVYSLSLTGADLETETTVDVEATFQKDTLFMEELLINISADVDAGKIKFDIWNEFKDFNDTEIDIPKDLKKELDL